MTAPKTLLLTGATGLIGRRLTRHFLERGHTVIATSRDPANLGALTAETKDASGTLIPIAIDLVAADLHRFVSELHERGGPPHYLVNNARDRANLAADGWPRRAQWLAEFELGVAVPAELALAVVAAEANRLEAIVNVASIYGVVAVNPRLYAEGENGAPAHYGVTKAALTHLTKELAVRLAPRGIRVNAVSFGGVEGRTDDAFKARYAALAPMGRMLRLDDLPGAIEFLLSPAAAGTTGHNLIVDGGWTLW